MHDGDGGNYGICPADGLSATVQIAGNAARQLGGGDIQGENDSHQSLKARADELPAQAYSFLSRPVRQIKTDPRQKPEHVRPEIARE